MKKKKKRTEGFFKKSLRLVWGSVLAVCAFFLTSYIIEFAMKKEINIPSVQKSLPFLINYKQSSKTAKEVPDEPISSPSQFSFFETLFQKEDSNNEKTMLARQKELAVNKVQETVKKIVQFDNAPNESEGGVFSIQLGSFQNREAAVSLIESLKKKGYSPYIISVANQDDTTFYRVRIGRFKNREDAFELAKTIEEKEKITVFVTSR